MSIKHRKWYIGFNLLRQINEKGYTLTSFADMINAAQNEIRVSQPKLSHIVSNKQRVKGRDVEIFAEQLGVKPEQLFDEEHHSVVNNIENQNGIANGHDYIVNGVSNDIIFELQQQITQINQRLAALEKHISL